MAVSFARVRPEFKDRLIEVFKKEGCIPTGSMMVYTPAQQEALKSCKTLADLKNLPGFTPPVLKLNKNVKLTEVVPKPTTVVSPRTPMFEAWNTLVGFCIEVKDKAPAIKIQTLKTLKMTPQLKKLFLLAFDASITFGIEPALVKKNLDLVLQPTSLTPDEMVSILDKLSTRELTGNAALEACVRAAKSSEFFLLLLGKNLEIRMGAASVNKAFPGLIPEFKVQLIQTWTPGMKPPVVAPRWFLDQKLDGERTLVFWNKGDIKIRNRAGAEVPTLNLFRDLLKVRMMEHFKDLRFVLDGEITKFVDGVESFQALETEIRRVDHQMEEATLVLFDLIPWDEFEAQKGTTPYFKRRQTLETIVNQIGWEYVKTSKIYWSGNHFPTDAEVQNPMKEITDNGGEGLVLKADLPYIGERTYQMLRCKPVHCEDFKVVDILYNDMMIPGKTEKMNVCSAIVVDLGNGLTCNIGSGFSWADRVAIKNNPDQILGKIAEVQYSIRTNDGSLRFPVIRAFYEKAGNDAGIPITLK